MGDSGLKLNIFRDSSSVKSSRMARNFFGMDYNKASGAEVRSMRLGNRGEAPVRIVGVGKTYSADQRMLWQSVSESEHISKWFAPISGDLRIGGRYKIEGNASGEVLRCVVPEVFEVTWEFSGKLSWVSVSLSSNGTSATLNLEHAEQVGDDATDKHWQEFGPGATGVGWDLSLLGLECFVRNQFVGFDRKEALAWMGSDSGKRFIRQCADAWRVAHVASGESPETARDMANRTATAYCGD